MKTKVEQTLKALQDAQDALDSNPDPAKEERLVMECRKAFDAFNAALHPIRMTPGMMQARRAQV